MFYHKVCNSAWASLKNKEAAAIENSGQGKRAKENANFKRRETGIIRERIVTVEVSKNEKVFTGWKSG